MITPATALPATEPHDPPRPFGWGREVSALLELFALSGLLFLPPIIDGLSRHSGETIVARHPTTAQLVAALAIIVIGPAVALWIVEALIGIRSAPVRLVVHAFFIGALSATLAFVILHRWDFMAQWLIPPLAGVAGVAMGGLVLRSRFTRRGLRILSVVPVVLAIVFLTGPVVGPVLDRSPGAAATGVTARTPQRVMMIVLDQLPTASLMNGAGTIDTRLFPNFAALSRQSTWYRNTTSVAPYTRVAVPAIADGRYPTDPGALPVSEQYPENVFTLLGDSFRLNVHEPGNESLCPESLCPRRVDNPVKGLVADAADDWQTEALADPSADECGRACDRPRTEDGVPIASSFLASLQRSTGPQLDYVHLLLPTAPWHLLGTGQDYAPVPEAPAGLDPDTGRWVSGTAGQIQRQRHLLQLQYVDRWLGQVIARLKAIGEFDSTSIIVTADHGIAFEGTAPYAVPAPETYQDVVWVPFFLKQAGQQAGRIDDRHASTIDVMPTVADLVGARLPWPVDGRSVLGPPRHDQDPRVLAWPSRSPDRPPDRAVYVRWRGPAGLQRLLATPATNPGLPDDLALFGTGPFAGLVGRDPKQFVDRSATGPVAYTPKAYYLLPLDPTTPVVSFADALVALVSRTPGTVAMTVNRRIAAVGPSLPGSNGGPVMRLVLSPQLFRAGRNSVHIYLVEGTPEAPKLVFLK